VSAGRDLSALLGSRICHDLISPLGAIGNGVELLAMSNAGSAPELALIAESVENANARIRLYRIAFGIASRNQGLGASEIRGILGDVYRQSRMVVSWQIDDDCMRGEVKLAFLILLCYETALPWGGRVAVQRDGAAWTFHGSAERMSVADDLWRLLEHPDPRTDLTSAQVHFALAPAAAAMLGRTCAVGVEPGLVSVRF
jgi:histidine phosphotransferase ChpT